MHLGIWGTRGERVKGNSLLAGVDATRATVAGRRGDGATILQLEPGVPGTDRVHQVSGGLELLTLEKTVVAAIGRGLGRNALAGRLVQFRTFAAGQRLVVETNPRFAHVERGGVQVIATVGTVRSFQFDALAGGSVAGFARLAHRVFVLALAVLANPGVTGVAVIAVGRTLTRSLDASPHSTNGAVTAVHGDVDADAVLARIGRAGIHVVATARAVCLEVLALAVGVAVVHRGRVLVVAGFGGVLADTLDALVDGAGVVVGALVVTFAAELAEPLYANFVVPAEGRVDALPAIIVVDGAGIVVEAGREQAVAGGRVAGVESGGVAVIAGHQRMNRLALEVVAGVESASVLVVQVFAVRRRIDALLAVDRFHDQAVGTLEVALFADGVAAVRDLAPIGGAVVVENAVVLDLGLDLLRGHDVTNGGVATLAGEIGVSVASDSQKGQRHDKGRDQGHRLHRSLSFRDVVKA